MTGKLTTETQSVCMALPSKIQSVATKAYLCVDTRRLDSIHRKKGCLVLSTDAHR